MKTIEEITLLGDIYRAAYQRAKAAGNREAEIHYAQICRILEWVIS